MNDQFQRTRDLFGKDIYDKIRSKKVIVFGIGGVGSSAILSLVRFGFTNITYVDYDVVDITNLNRQVFTKHKSIGQYKCLALKDYIEEINKDINIYYFIKKLNGNISYFNLDNYDYVIDAIDTISAKLDLIEYCYNNDIYIISSMGTGNKLDPGKLEVKDIYETSYDPLAKVMRKELRARGVKKLKVVCSKEESLKKSIRIGGKNKSTPFSTSFVPPVSGYMMASEIIRDIYNKEKGDD